MVAGEPLNRENLSAFRLEKRYEATIHQDAVYRYRARTTLALSATLLWAGQSEVLAQHVKQSFHRIGGYRLPLAIHSEGDFALGGNCRGVGHRRPSAES